MNITHSEMVRKLVKSGDQIKQDLTSADCNLIHSILGICGEAGELLDTVKKATIYRKPLDIENIKEEIGDALFYIEQLCQATGLTIEECLAANISKLSKRYPNFEYSNQKAQERLDKIESICECAGSGEIAQYDDPTYTMMVCPTCCGDGKA